MSTERFVIVGGGLAAATAAETLREEGFDGTIQVFGSEPHLPYVRPPLTKEYLTGKDDRGSIFVHTADWYVEQGIDIQLGTAVASIDRVRRELTMADGRIAPYDRLLLATGATPRRSGVPGADAAGIHYVRTVDDSESLRDELANGGKRVAIVGSGWIGLEIASAARGYGNDVTVVSRDAVPLQGPLGDELGAVFRRLHEENGVRFQLRAPVRSFAVANGRVTGVTTDAGDPVSADMVVVGLGAIPNTALADAAGLDVDGGLELDEHLATNDPLIFGAGDIANAMHPVIHRRMRNEHWANAIGTGRVAAKSMLGQDAVFDEIPYFYTDQFDLGMEYSGYPPLAAHATVVVRGDKDAREFVAFWVADGRVVAGMNVNVWDVNESVQELIRSGRVVDVAQLADPEVPLADVFAG